VFIIVCRSRRFFKASLQGANSILYVWDGNVDDCCQRIDMQQISKLPLNDKSARNKREAS